jgi:hypothetical protein
MIKRAFAMLITLLIISGVLTGCGTDSKVSMARTEPIFIFSSIRLESDKLGLMYPEVAVNQDGTWRKSDIKDLWVDQKFNTFSQEKIETEAVVSKVPDVLPVQIKTGFETEKIIFCFGINTTQKIFENKATGTLNRPKNIDSKAQKELSKELTKSQFKKVVELDWRNILNDYDYKELLIKVVDCVSGDLNGDKKKDYVVILGDGPFHDDLFLLKGTGGAAAVVAYVSEGKEYKRIPLDYWNSTLKSWPVIFFMRDVNGDNREELFLSNQDTGADHFIVYSWFNEGLKKLYGSKNVNTSLE